MSPKLVAVCFQGLAKLEDVLYVDHVSFHSRHPHIVRLRTLGCAGGRINWVEKTMRWIFKVQSCIGLGDIEALQLPL